jgi:hypothetical protein
MVADEKFTLPLIKYLINDLRLKNHRFLIVDLNQNASLIKNENLVTLTCPLRYNLIGNFFKFILEVSKADKIITHGAPLSYFFILCPWVLSKVFWAIQGGIDIPNTIISNSFAENINIKFKKRIRFHVSHIEEDSEFVNRTLGVQAKFIYSPTYLSNVTKSIKREAEFVYNKGFYSSNILVGNSNDPSNKHIQVFDLLMTCDLKPAAVYSILSYGIYSEYKKQIVEEGFKRFGKNFISVTEFMGLDEYIKLLDKIDYVIFNHERQEAMGATIQLMSLAKPIFFNPVSPAYISFKRRGYNVFSNQELRNFEKINSVDLRCNRDLLIRDYSIDNLNSFYINL